ncbi:MAG TPA: hypothetical protein VKR59_12755 [Terriglobales bacterium]|nr:hypothetical protein [Terriglobales bacterium]
MKLGTENRKQLIALAVLGGIAVLALAYEFWPASSSSAPEATKLPAALAKPAMRRTSSGKMVPVVEPRLDPTLDLNLLTRSEEIKYAGNGRNIFVAGSSPSIEPPKGHGVTDQPQSATLTTPVIQPPPPITLKFFGFANRPGETKKVFLSQGEDVFIAAEGDIVNRRYRVLRISPNAVDVEDVINNNRQSLPLVQG